MSVSPSEFISASEASEMSSVFQTLAESGKSVTRLPRKEFDRRQIVAAFQEAFDLIGGVPRLAIWAHHNPTEFYKLYGKLIPASSHLELAGQVQHIIRPALSPSPLDLVGVSHAPYSLPPPGIPEPVPEGALPEN